MRGQERQRRRCDAVDAARLADGSGSNRIQLLSHFNRQPGDRRVVEAILQLETFVPSVRRNVGSLAVQVDRILGIDLELLADPRIERGEFRPDARDFVETDGWVGEQLERGATLAISVRQ